MKQLYTYLTLTFCCFVFFAYAQKKRLPLDPTVISSMSLYNPLLKKKTNVEWQKGNPLHLFVFLAPDCPLCRNYAPLINEIETTYVNKVQVSGIVPGSSYADSLINKFKKEFLLQFLIFKDNKQQLKKYFDASTTPEVFLLDNNGLLIYQGAIDNWAVALGKQRAKATEHYLLDAIQKSLNGIPVAIRYMEPIGCIINDY